MLCHRVSSGAFCGASAPRRYNALQSPNRPGVVLRHRSLKPVAMMNSGGPPVGDRVAATLPYFLPLLDGVAFGRFLFMSYPGLARTFAPLAPLQAVYNGVPFLP